MPPQGSRLLKKQHSSSSSSSDYGFQPKQLSKSPPPSPSADRKSRPEPWPYVPSSNPAAQYSLLEKLGTGSFGTVYKAIHNDSKQIVAIKQIGAFLTFTHMKFANASAQIWRIQTTTSLRYSKKSQAWHSATPSMSLGTTGLSSSRTSCG